MDSAINNHINKIKKQKALRNVFKTFEYSCYSVKEFVPIPFILCFFIGGSRFGILLCLSCLAGICFLYCAVEKF